MWNNDKLAFDITELSKFPLPLTTMHTKFNSHLQLNKTYPKQFVHPYTNFKYIRSKSHAKHPAQILSDDLYILEIYLYTKIGDKSKNTYTADFSVRREKCKK